MKTTAKFRRALKSAISSGMCRAIDEICPEIGDNPPETWDEDTRKRFDMVTEIERCISREIDKVLNP